MSDLSHIKSNNASDFVRSEANPGALVNTNNEALQAYKKTKARYNQLNRIEEVFGRIDALESRFDRIESLLLMIAESQNAS